MSSSLRKVKSEGVGPNATGASEWDGAALRLGDCLATISVLDLLALDDVTTAGAWMPEIVFLIASIPALVTLA